MPETPRDNKPPPAPRQPPPPRNHCRNPPPPIQFKGTGFVSSPEARLCPTPSAHSTNPFLLSVCIATSLLLAGCDPDGSDSSSGGSSGAGETHHAGNSPLPTPTDWQVSEGDGGCVLVARAPRDTPVDRFVQNASVRAIPRGKKENAAAFLDRLQAANARGLRGYALLEETDTTVDGEPGRRLVFTHQVSSGVYVKSLAYTVAGDGRGYVLTCSAEEGKFDVYLDRFEAVCRTFKLEAKTPGGAWDGGALIPEPQ